MSKDPVSSRRAFLKGGALAAAPLAVVASGSAMAADRGAERLQRLEDEATIRELHQTWLRRVNAGAHREAASLFADPGRARFDEAVRRLAADHAAAPDVLELAADGQKASGLYGFAVEIETELPRDCTLAQMAHAQGNGAVRSTERRVLKAEYVKAGGAWVIASVVLAPA